MQDVNNQFYDGLGRIGWLEDPEHAIALLRMETPIRLDYIKRILSSHSQKSPKILDIGCGGGLISNALVADGFQVCGVDLSQASVEVAYETCPDPERACYMVGDAMRLSDCLDGRFQVCLLMDVLEHVDDPAKVIAEAAQQLVPGGLLIFHTFHRTLLSYLVGVKGVEWLSAQCPRNLHVWRKFVKPYELSRMAEANHLSIRDFRGIRPCFSWPLVKSLLTGRVQEGFSFTYTSLLWAGYMGYGTKVLSALPSA